MSFIEQLNAIGVKKDSTVYFTRSESCDVLHFRDDYIDSAMSETQIASSFAEALTEGPFYRHKCDVLEEMRNDGLLDSYDRGEFTFSEFVQEVIEENHYDYDWFDRSLDRFDHKRGSLELSYTIALPVDTVMSNPEDFQNLWNYQISATAEAGNEVSIDV